MTTDTTPTPPAGRSKGKTIGIAAAVLLLGCCGLFAISSMIGGGDTPATTQAPAADAPAADAPAGDVATEEPAAEEATDAPADTEVPPTAAPKVGEPVQVGESHSWMVHSVEDRGQTIDSGNQFIPSLQTSGKFLMVTAGVMNGGDDAFFITAPKIVDSQDREFDHSSDAFMIVDSTQQCALEEINPGLQKDCTWIYEVPAGATGLKLRVAGGLFDTPVDVDLGQ